MVFLGIEREDGKFAGPTGAQTPTPRYFDHVLGVTLEGNDFLTNVLKKFEDFMPKAHKRAMLDFRSGDKSIREYVLDHNDNHSLVDAYNSAIDGLASWRTHHLKAMVGQFIVWPLAKKEGWSIAETWGKTGNGTGGSDIRSYLTHHIQATLNMKCPFSNGGLFKCPFSNAGQGPRRILPTRIAYANAEDTRSRRRTRTVAAVLAAAIVAGATMQ